MLSRNRWLAVVGAVSLLPACHDPGPSAPTELAAVHVDALLPSTVRSLVVEISGPGVAPDARANLDVGPDSIARGTLHVTAGSARRLVVTAVDTAGAASHRADTTLALIAGENPPIALTLRPLVPSGPVP